MERFENCRNPVLPPSICIADGEAHVFADGLYVFGSWDQYADDYCSEEYRVVSTKDMKNWTIYDKSLDGREIPWLTNGKKYYVTDMNLRDPAPFFKNMVEEIQKQLPKEMQVSLDTVSEGDLPESIDFGQYAKNPYLLFAPDCICKDGKYYLYFCTSANLEGVAVSDKPEGPFEKPRQLPCAGIDPAVFIDDDGKAYYYWGQFRASGVELNPDMVSFDEEKIVKKLVTEEEHGFHEGSSMRKRDGIYYYVYPCIYRDNKPTCLAYATSGSPLGPFTYRGIIIDNAKCDPQSWNIHGSIECFEGQWYVFYHRSSKNGKTSRRLCVEPIYFNEDGTIDEVKMTSVGAGNPFDMDEAIQGWRACEVDGGAYVSDYDLVMKDESSAVIRYVKIDAPVRGVRVEKDGEGTVEVRIAGKDWWEAENGVAEVELRCTGDAVVHAVTIEK
jgi:hypothetical protein